MTVNLTRALRTVDRGFSIEEVVTNNGERRLVAFAGDEQGVRIIQEIASLYNYVPHPTEVASTGGVILVERAASDEDDEDEDELVGDTDEDEDEDDSDSSDEEEDENLDDIPGGGDGLRYLNTAEGHKFTLRVFTQMLGNEDMSRYAQFLIDVDRLFGKYVNKDGADFGNRKKKLEEAMVEIASEILSADEVTAQIEEAKKKAKKGRAALLSALMTAISGDFGEKLAAAWDKGDHSRVREYLTEAISEVVAAMPKKEPDEPPKDEAAGTEPAEASA